MKSIIYRTDQALLKSLMRVYPKSPLTLPYPMIMIVHGNGFRSSFMTLVIIKVIPSLTQDPLFCVMLALPGERLLIGTQTEMVG